MDDRTLLEKAAKAAGYELSKLHPEPMVVTRRDSGFVETITPWNPLTDDGEALRLLCKRSMRIIENHGGAYRAVQFTLHAETDDEAEREVEIEWPHTPAAHRYAIVRAAAAMADKGGAN